MSIDHIKLLANNYLNAYRKREVDHEALETINYLLENLSSGLLLINELIDLAQNDAELAFISAGPFEDLFTKHYTSIFKSLDQILRKNAKMRKALTGIWINHSKAKLVLDQLLNKYHLSYASL